MAEGSRYDVQTALLTEDRVHEQDFPSVHIWGELGVVDFGFLRLLVALDEDLADSYGAAAVTEALLHGLTCDGTNSTRNIVWLISGSSRFSFAHFFICVAVGCETLRRSSTAAACSLSKKGKKIQHN